MDGIGAKNLSRVSYACHAPARALLHLETHLRQNPPDLENCVSDLQQIYGALNEADFVFGLVQIRKTEPTVEELMQQHQITGNFQVFTTDAAAQLDFRTICPQM